MNEEIKKKIIEECTTWSVEYMLKMMNEYEELVRKQAYLQGAKDAIEAVKIDEINVFDMYWGKSEIEHGFEQSYNKAVRNMERKAQQFLDSLEKGTNNE